MNSNLSYEEQMAILNKRIESVEIEAKQREIEYERQRQEDEKRRQEEAKQREEATKERDEKREIEAKQREKETKERDEKREKEWKNTQIQMEELRKFSREIGRQLRDIGFNNGYFAEDYFYYALRKTLTLGKHKFDIIDQHILFPDNAGELDLMLRNGDSIGIIEVKYGANYKKITELKRKQIELFRKYYPECADYKVYYGIATMSSNKNLEMVAKREKIFLLTQKGEDFIQFLNEDVIAF